MRPFPRVRDLLQRIREEGLRIAFATSAKQDELEQYRKLLHVDDLIEEQTTKDDARHSKTGARHLRCCPGETGSRSGGSGRRGRHAVRCPRLPHARSPDHRIAMRRFLRRGITRRRMLYRLSRSSRPLGKFRAVAALSEKSRVSIGHQRTIARLASARSFIAFRPSPDGSKTSAASSHSSEELLFISGRRGLLAFALRFGL